MVGGKTGVCLEVMDITAIMIVKIHVMLVALAHQPSTTPHHPPS